MRVIFSKVLLSLTAFTVFGVLVTVFPVSAEILYTITDLGSGVALDINNLSH